MSAIENIVFTVFQISLAFPLPPNGFTKTIILNLGGFSMTHSRQLTLINVTHTLYWSTTKSTSNGSHPAKSNFIVFTNEWKNLSCPHSIVFFHLLKDINNKTIMIFWMKFYSNKIVQRYMKCWLFICEKKCHDRYCYYRT